MAVLPVQITTTAAGLQFSGELTRENCARFISQLAALSLPEGPLHIELAEFDIADGVAAVEAVNAVRELARNRSLVLAHAPQILGHNLYRVGGLGVGSSIVLDAMREDEAYG